MSGELGKVRLYLSKEGCSFDELIDESKIPNQSRAFQVREFQIEKDNELEEPYEDSESRKLNCKFFCQQVLNSQDENPIWLDFVNENLEESNSVNFETLTQRPSGLVLIVIRNRLIAACFGTRGASWMKRSRLVSDFGIKVAMNMCGNEEVRQAKSRVHSY